MVFVTTSSSTNSNRTKTLHDRAIPLARSSSRAFTSLSLLQAVIEALLDGVMIVTDRGEVIEVSASAHAMCDKLNQSYTGATSRGSTQQTPLPSEVWRVCKALIEIRRLFPTQQLLESEVTLEDGNQVKIRVQWLEITNEMQSTAYSYMLVTLKDWEQFIQQLVLSDTHRYGLTAREAEVWKLRLHRHSYRTIAARLFITENTVRKHVKNILSKRRVVLQDAK